MKNLESFSFAATAARVDERSLLGTGRISFFDMPESTKSQIAEILRQQVETFQQEYDIQRYDERNEQGKDQFIIELKCWINKFEVAEKLKNAQVSLRNSLITFTDADA